MATPINIPIFVDELNELPRKIIIKSPEFIQTLLRTPPMIRDGPFFESMLQKSPNDHPIGCLYSHEIFP